MHQHPINHSTYKGCFELCISQYEFFQIPSCPTEYTRIFLGHIKVKWFELGSSLSWSRLPHSGSDCSSPCKNQSLCVRTSIIAIFKCVQWSLGQLMHCISEHHLTTKVELWPTGKPRPGLAHWSYWQKLQECCKQVSRKWRSDKAVSIGGVYC